MITLQRVIGIRKKGHRITSYNVCYTKLLRELKAKSYKCTLKDICLAAHVYLLSILTTETDIITGVVTHDRNATEDAEKILGCFLNTIPNRIKVEDKEKKTELIKKIQKSIKGIKQNEMFLAEIAGIVGDSGNSGSPIFDTLHRITSYNVCYTKLLRI